MKSRRVGLGRGKGKGYTNLLKTDPLVHSKSRKGRKTYSNPTARKMDKQNIPKGTREQMPDGNILAIVKTDNEFPYQVQLETPEGEVLSKTLLMETIEEARESFKDSKSDYLKKEIGKDTFYQEVRDDLKSKGFQVTGDYDLQVTKGAYKFEVSREDVMNGEYKALFRNFDNIVVPVVDSFKGKDDVFYSSIYSEIKSRTPYSKRKGVLFNAVVDILKNKGVMVHS